MSGIKNILETPEVQGHEISGDRLRSFARIQNDKKLNRRQLPVNNHLPAKFTLTRIQLIAQSKFLCFIDKK